MKLGKSGLVLLLAGAMLATLASIAGAWTYSTEVIQYQGSPFIIGTHTGQTYTYRVGVATNNSSEAQTLDVELNYHDDFIGQYWYSIDDGASWIEVPRGQASLSVDNVASGDSVQLRAVVIVSYRYLSTSPWGEADESIGDEYYYAFPPGGRYYAPGTSNVDITGFVAVTNLSSSDTWTYSTEGVEYQGSALVMGTKTGQTYMYRVGVVTNDSAAPQTLDVELNYQDGFFGQYWYSVDDGANWIEVPKNQATLSVDNVGSGASVQLRAVTIYYRYLSTSPFGVADESIGEGYYFAFPPGGRYYAPGTSDVDKAGFVAVTSYTAPVDDLDGDGQTVGEGDCNDQDDTIYTGAPEVCGDGIDQDCDGEDESCVIETVTSAGLVWMDRNLGASRVATNMTDPLAKGDHYQWGRGTDGHELDNSATTAVLSNSDYPGHGYFITTDSEPHDWRTPQNDNLWQGESGINNPCPSGFRLPTETEFTVERSSWSLGPNGYMFHDEAAYASPLRLIGANCRESDGTFGPGATWGCYWTSTVIDSEAKYFDFNPGWSTTYRQDRSWGLSVRCIQDYSDDDIDQDGQTINEGDCDDLDDTIYAGAPEICGDGIDQDCDGADEVCADLDQDGQTVFEGDCNDLDDTIYKGAPEVCGDGIDQNCDGWDEPCGLPAETVFSAGQIWMDRNLGASRVATSEDDVEAYGDLYQWGRLTDGHEKRNSGTTSTPSPTDVPGHGDFITANNVYPRDWRTTVNNNLWQGESGINNPCPAGFRLPTEIEFLTERNSWDTRDSAGAYGAPTKFIIAGERYYKTGEIRFTEYIGQYWSSTVYLDNAKYMYITHNSAGFNDYGRASGHSVRCIMEMDPDMDMDQDGQSINQGDCNDLDSTIYTGAPEICEDGIDQDCDAAEAPCEDLDQDGQSVNQGDCDDLDSMIYTGAPEICEDGIDQNCNGADESCPITVISAGQVWMDRNLGASRVATSSTDPESYGDLYQWGRLTDGHEKRTSGTTSTRSVFDAPGHDNFITVNKPFSDWRTQQNDNLWQGESGINNPCPSGFRLPTATELDSERASWHPQNAAGAYSSPAKFAVAGYRGSKYGEVNADSQGYYWSSTVSGDHVDNLLIRAGYTNMTDSNRATGQSVRCIQD